MLRTASVTAASEKVVCMSIDRTTFTTLLGPLTAIEKRGNFYQQITKPKSTQHRRSAIYAETLRCGRREVHRTERGAQVHV